MTNKPSIIERAKLAIRYYQRGLPGVMRSRAPDPSVGKAMPFIWPSFRQGQAQWHIIDYSSYVAEGFNLNSLIYSAVMYKAKSISFPKLKAYKGDPESPEQLDPGHDLSRLVKRPNPSMSWREFQMLQDVYLNIDGNAYAFMDRPKAGDLPTAIYPMRPDRMYIVPWPKGKGRGIMGYVYVPEGKSMVDGVPMVEQDVSHVKLPNPGDELDGMGYGLSPMSAMARSADVDNMITEFLKIFFERGAIVPGLLSFEGNIDDETTDVIKERWKEMYGSYEHWTEIGVLGKGGEYKRVGMGFEEMGFEVQDERNESRVLGPFGVPPILIGTRLGLMRSTYENYEEARRQFWEDTMLPETSLFEDDYQYYLISEDGGWVAFDYTDVPALKVNMGELVEAYVSLIQHGTPKNVAAALVGIPLEELPDGGVIYMPVNMVAVGSIEDGLVEPEQLVEGDPEGSVDDGSAGGDGDGSDTPEAEEDQEDEERKAGPGVEEEKKV